MKIIKCIIIEDEPLAMNVIKYYVEQETCLYLCGTFRDASSAADFLRQHTVGLIFLDIHLPGMKGLDFLRSLIHPPLAIVTTAYHQYAVEGYELNVIDYLLKPVSFARFSKAINKVFNNLPENITSKTPTPNNSGCIYLTVQRKKVKINLDDIYFIESKKEYIQVVTSGNVYTSKLSTHIIEQDLPSSAFIRVHRSFIVAIDKIDSFSKEYVDVKSTSIRIGKSYKQRFEEQMNSLNNL